MILESKMSRAHGVVGYHARLACERCWVQFPMCPLVLLLLLFMAVVYICSKELVKVLTTDHLVQHKQLIILPRCPLCFHRTRADLRSSTH